MTIVKAFVDASYALAQLTADGEAVQKSVNQVTRTYTQVLKTKIQAKASGRPGPNAPTGDYRRSWTIEFHEKDGDVIGEVGTIKPQGRRLEYGFNGVDSLGRTYNQPPYPHVAPAVAEIEQPYHDALRRALSLTA